jgi:hypothetical protein
LCVGILALHWWEIWSQLILKWSWTVIIPEMPQPQVSMIPKSWRLVYTTPGKPYRKSLSFKKTKLLDCITPQKPYRKSLWYLKASLDSITPKKPYASFYLPIKAGLNSITPEKSFRKSLSSHKIWIDGLCHPNRIHHKSLSSQKAGFLDSITPRKATSHTASLYLPIKAGLLDIITHPWLYRAFHLLGVHGIRQSESDPIGRIPPIYAFS